MNELFLRYREKVLRMVQSYTTKQKVFFIAAFVLTGVTVFILMQQFSQTEYSTAFTNLNANDASNVKAYLEENQIPYKLSADGKTIGVPSTRVSEVKIDVTAKGMLTNGAIGYEIFRENMSSWSMTDSQFNVIDSDARAGEIQRLINAINGVGTSEVLINMPKDTVFIADTTTEATASAVVTFLPGYPPDQAKIDTIYNLVAKSIPNLPLENITISDQNGELLPSSKLGATVGVATQVEQQLRIKKQFELDLQRNVMRFLMPLIGKDDVIVSVVSSLNFDKKTSDQNLVTPVNTEEGSGIIISRQANEESAQGVTRPDGGVVGTGETDVPGYTTTDTGQNYDSEKSNLMENYEINRIRNQIVSSPYVVQDLSISVGLNTQGMNDQTIEPETIEQVRTLLQSIVTASIANSGTQLTPEQLASRVSVIARTFKSTADTATWPLNQIILYSIIGTLVLIGLFFGGFFWWKRRRAKVVEPVVTAPQPPPEPEEEMELTLGQLGAMNTNQNQLRRQLELLAVRKPDEFANLLRTWLAED